MRVTGAFNKDKKTLNNTSVFIQKQSQMSATLKPKDTFKEKEQNRPKSSHAKKAEENELI